MGNTAIMPSLLSIIIKSRVVVTVRRHWHWTLFRSRSAYKYMPSTERTTLLNDYSRPRWSFYQKVHTLLRAEGEPSWQDSCQWFLFGCRLNIFLLLAPVAAAAHHLKWDAPLRFGFSFIAILPFAKVCKTSLRTWQGLRAVLSYLGRPRSRCLSLLGRLLLAC
jgi:hypothetical protein